MTPDLKDFSTLEPLSGTDISKFKDSYWSFIQSSGTIWTRVYGFHLGFSDDERLARTTEILETFRPILIYAGTSVIEEQLKVMGRSSISSSWFEEGGFAVLYVVPLTD